METAYGYLTHSLHSLQLPTMAVFAQGTLGPPSQSCSTNNEGVDTTHSVCKVASLESPCKSVYAACMLLYMWLVHSCCHQPTFQVSWVHCFILQPGEPFCNFCYPCTVYHSVTDTSFMLL